MIVIKYNPYIISVSSFRIEERVNIMIEPTTIIIVILIVLLNWALLCLNSALTLLKLPISKFTLTWIALRRFLFYEINLRYTF